MKFKVGDKVRLINNDKDWSKNIPIGTSGIITDADTFHSPTDVPYNIEWDGVSKDSWAKEEWLELFKKGSGNVKGKKYSFKVFKNDCNNYESVIEADTVKEAIKIFENEFKDRAGYTLYKPIRSSFEEKKVMFK